MLVSLVCRQAQYAANAEGPGARGRLWQPQIRDWPASCGHSTGYAQQFTNEEEYLLNDLFNNGPEPAAEDPADERCGPPALGTETWYFPKAWHCVQAYNARPRNINAPKQ